MFFSISTANKEPDTFLSGGMGGEAPVPNLTGRSPYLTEQVNSPRKSGAERSSRAES